MTTEGDILRKINTMRPPLRLCSIQKTEDETCGFHLSRTQWDPYPWISNVEEGSPAAIAGITIGDFVIEVNGEDILGMRIDEVAHKVRLKSDSVRLLVWKSPIPETEHKLPAAFNLQKFSGFLQSTMQLIECPVCLDISSVPTFYQCLNGHILCAECRQRTVKCPMCRVPLSGRGRCLIAEKLHRLVRKTLSVKSPERKTDVPTRNSATNELFVTQKQKSEYFCPWNEPCEEKLSGEKRVISHLHTDHGGSYIHYITHGESLVVHIPKTTFAVCITTQHNHKFFLRKNSSGHCWISVLSDNDTAKHYLFSLKTELEEQEKLCTVSSLHNPIETIVKKYDCYKILQSATEVHVRITQNRLKDS